MGVLKFLHEQDAGRHGGPLHWGGLVGADFAFPFRGATSVLRKEELDKVEQSTDFCFRNFDLEEPEDMRLYQEVMDRVVAGWYYVIRKMPWVNPVTGAMRVYLEWGQRYNELPKRNVDPLAI